MEVAAVCEELEGLRLEMEKLREEYRVKCEMSNTLRRAHDEQLARLQEAKVEIEKQSKEIAAKVEEIFSAKQMYDELKSNFLEKESALKNLALANENIRSGNREKIMDLEAKNRELVSALDEAHNKREEQERVINVYKEEIQGLRDLLMASEKKCSDAEHRALAPKEVRRRDEMLLKIEEEKGEVENQLKWKVEQFRHLQEAHTKLQDEFRADKREWGSERSGLVKEIHSLQINLDSNIRLSEELRSQLMMCNQALAHEHSRRKLLEAQVSESRVMYDSVVSEYEDARLNIEALIAKRDDEIALLRSTLITNAANLKESEFRMNQLEQENQELQMRLKEYDEAQINEVDAAASLKMMRQNVKALELAHRSCSEKLKTRQAEWESHTEQLRTELAECLYQLNFKDKQLFDMRDQIDGNETLLMQQKLNNFEIFVILMVVKEKFIEACSVLDTFALEMNTDCGKVKERVVFLMKQLEDKNNALVQHQAELKRVNDILNSLQAKIECLELTELKYFNVIKELGKFKSLLEESSRNHDLFKQQALQKENDLHNDLRKASDALEQANCALAKKMSELRNLEFDLQQKNLMLERMHQLKSNLEIQLENGADERKAITKELDTAYLAMKKAEDTMMKMKESFHQRLEEKDNKIEELKQQIGLVEEANERQKLEVATLVKSEVAKSSTRENEKLLENIRDFNSRLEETQKAIRVVEHKYISQQMEMLMTFDQEEAKILKVIEDKENVLAGLEQQVVLLGKDFSLLAEDAAAFKSEQRAFYEELEKIVAAIIVGEQEIQLQTILIDEMEEEISYLHLKLKSEEKLSWDSKNCIRQLKSELSKHKLENEHKRVELMNELESLQSKKKTMEEQLRELDSNLKALQGVLAKFSLEREELVGEMMGFNNLIRTIFCSDEQLMKNWERVLQKAKDDDEVLNCERKVLSSSIAVDRRNYVSIARSKVGGISGRRSPLKEQNC